MHSLLITKAKSQGFNPQHAADAFGLEVEDIVDIISDYFNVAQRDVRAFQAACVENNMDELSRISHRMKGSASNLRLRHISTLAKEIEHASKANNHDYDYKSSAKTIKELIAIAKEQFKGLQ